MTSETRLEARVASLIGDYADRVSTAIDPIAITHLAAAPSSRTSSERWRGVAGRDLRPVLLVVGLLLALLAGVSAGAQRFVRDSEDVLPRSGAVEPFLGLPPEGVLPSRPARGEAVLRFMARVPSLGMDVHWMSLYEDGRLIWGRNLESRYDLSAFAGLAPTVHGPTVIEQRLTAAGVERVRAEVLANGSPAPAFGGYHAETQGPGVVWGGIQVLDGDRMVDVRWTDAGLPGRLANLASWLPNSDWADQMIGAYVAPRYGVCDVDQGSEAWPSRVTDAVLARSTGRSGTDGEPACYVVDLDAAREIAVILADAAIRSDVTYNGTEYVFTNGNGPSQEGRILLVPLTPDDRGIWVGWGG